MAGSDQINQNECKRIVPLNTWILISNFKLAYNLLRRSDGTFNRELDEFLDRKVPQNTTPSPDGTYSFDELNKTTNLTNRIYLSINHHPHTPPQTPTGFTGNQTPLSLDTPIPVIVYFHGGSFTHSSANTAIYDTWCRRLVNICSAVVISVNYRRSPEHRYPAAYDDSWEAVKWVSTRPWLRSGKDSKVRIYLAGDSSGGNIAHHVAVRAATEPELKISVFGNILLHPMFGGEMRTESEKKLDGKYFVTVQDRDWYWRAYLPDGEDRDHPACNIFGPRGKGIEEAVKNFPKTLVVVAGLDLVQDWQLEYVKGLRRRSGNGVKLLYLEKATIGFYFLPNNEHFQMLKEEIRAFVDSTNCE